jgi:hypothetical protein
MSMSRVRVLEACSINREIPSCQGETRLSEGCKPILVER